jgi:hypothetical protein
MLLTVPLYFHFPTGRQLPQIRRLRLELEYEDRPGLFQPCRCYGIWSPFLILDAQ